MTVDGGRDWGLIARMVAAAVLLVVANLAFVALVDWLVTTWLPVAAAAMELPVGREWPSLPLLPSTVAFLVAQYVYATRRPVGASGVTGHDAPADVEARLQRLAAQAGVPAPNVVVADAPAANSYTVGRRGNATVVLTDPLLEALDDDELDAVLAHEVAHVANRDVTVMTMATTPFRLAGRLSLAIDRFAYVTGSVLYWLLMAGITLLTGGMIVYLIYAWLVDVFTSGTGPQQSMEGFHAAVPFVGLIVVGIPHVGAYLLLATLFAMVPLAATGAYRVLLDPVPRLLTRYREFAADRGAARITGDPAALASALETLADDARPETDARAVAPVAALCVRPVGVGSPPPVGPFRATLAEHLPRLGRVLDRVLDRLAGRLVAHPSTDERVDRLRALAG